MSNTPYTELLTRAKEVWLLGTVSSILHWDQETQMPPNGAGHRANQQALVARLAHERATDPRIGDLLASCESSRDMADPEGDQATNVREIRRAYSRAIKLPSALVEEMARVSVLAHQAWAEARKSSDFAHFSPWLAKVLKIKQEEAACVGYKDNPYDALLDEYEPDETSANLVKVFESLRAPLVELVGRIASTGRRAPTEILERPAPIAAQQEFGCMAARAIGFDFNAGRMDVSVHPFCTDIGPGDVRITTRYDEKAFGDSLFSVLHESGHAMYEQGFLPEHAGTPLGQAISLGIHESQSRMWENLVGRSRAFWTHYFPTARQFFPSLADVSFDDFYRAINATEPGYIRVDADEATYNLHVLLRFEIEQALLNKDLSIADLPGAWNEKMQKYLGVTPPDDARGCLQDVHWSGGAFGYFATYTLGNLYACQFFDQAKHDIPTLETSFAAGDFAPLLKWLRTNIHQHGRRFSAGRLVKKVTGSALSSAPLLTHLRRKALEVYGV